jgi:tRNA pseudouridine38-40 synthase
MDERCAAREGVRRMAVLLEYDGTAFRGSQYQDEGRTVQGELEAAINNLTGETVRAAFAGRTDAGVHAMGQVAAFDTHSAIEARAFVRGLNHFLPPDVAVQAARECEPAFNPRRDATGRTYRYAIEQRPERSPLWGLRAWQLGRTLDIAAMHAGGRALEGTHDFAAFAGPYEGSTVRTLRRCEVSAHGACVQVTMEAQAFLPHQVRRTAGALVEVGSGRLDQAGLLRLLEMAAPASSGPTAPACGLYLVQVAYDGFAFEAAMEDGRDE